MGRGPALRCMRRRGSTRVNRRRRRRKCYGRCRLCFGSARGVTGRLWARRERLGRCLLLVCEVLTISLPCFLFSRFHASCSAEGWEEWFSGHWVMMVWAGRGMCLPDGSEVGQRVGILFKFQVIVC